MPSLYIQLHGICKILHLKANGLCCSMHGLHEHYIITGCKLERMTPRHRISEVLKCMSVLYVKNWKSITCSECVCVCVCVCVCCVCSLRNPACKARAPYYTAIRGLSGSTKLFHITSQRVRFSEKKKLFDIKCALLFALQLVSETYFTLRRIQRNIVINLRKYS